MLDPPHRQMEIGGPGTLMSYWTPGAPSRVCRVLDPVGPRARAPEVISDQVKEGACDRRVAHSGVSAKVRAMSGASRKLRVIHFGSGGGKGVTRIVANLAIGHSARGCFDTLVVFRRKRGRALGTAFQRDLAFAGVGWREVVPRPKLRTVAELRNIIRVFRPDVFVAHGYCEHIWGRFAALAEAVPVVVHVEHAHEHYSLLNRWRSRRLARRTDAIVGVSEGVKARLVELGLPRDRLSIIYNGIQLQQYVEPPPPPCAQREAAIVMVARFASSKDHATLIRAVALLRQRGMDVRTRLVGDGKRLSRLKAHWWCWRLGVTDLVDFLGPRNNVSTLFRQHRVAVLSTHSEGFGLAVAESMAAGCAVVASCVCGVEELIEHNRTGWLATPLDPGALADGIAAALGPAGERWAAACAPIARARFGLDRMTEDYERLIEHLVRSKARAVVASTAALRGVPRLAPEMSGGEALQIDGVAAHRAHDPLGVEQREVAAGRQRMEAIDVDT